MKVFTPDKMDYIAAKTIEEAAACYKENFGEDDFELQECSLQDTMWYGFDILHDDLIKMIIKSGKEYIIKNDKRCDFYLVIKLTFEEVIKFDNITEPCLISSTEF